MVGKSAIFGALGLSTTPAPGVPGSFYFLSLRQKTPINFFHPPCCGLFSEMNLQPRVRESRSLSLSYYDWSLVLEADIFRYVVGNSELDGKPKEKIAYCRCLTGNNCFHKKDLLCWIKFFSYGNILLKQQYLLRKMRQFYRRLIRIYPSWAAYHYDFNIA